MTRQTVNGGSHRLKILFIIDELRESGGAERALLKTISLLPISKYNVQLVTFRLDPQLDILRDLKCALHVLPLRRTYDANGFRMACRLSRFIRSERIQVVHTFFETSDLWAGPIARLSRVPLLISSRRDMGILRTAKHRFAYRLIGRLFDQTQTVSEMVRQEFIGTDGLSPSRVVTIHNGVTLARIDEVPASEAMRVRRRLDLGGASHVITAVGHIRRVKGFDILVRAAAVVRRRFPKALFVIAGANHDPEYFEELATLARTAGVSDNVRLVGPVSDVIPLLKASDVFCLPSRSEGLSNALLEAMACGLPAVATRVGGNPEVIEHGRSGYLIETEDVEGLSQGVMALLENADRRAEMGCTARQVVEDRFSDEQMMTRLMGEYERLLSAKSGAAFAA